MSHITIILSVLFACLLLLWMAPGTFALNRGNVLRNIALWLAIFVGLALVYRNFGPGSPHPVFGSPAGVQTPFPDDGETAAHPSVKPSGKSDDKDDGSQGYTPPKE